MKKIITSLLPVLLIGYILFQGGCVKENFDTVPNVEATSNLVTTLSIAELKAQIPTTYDSVYSIERRLIRTGFIDAIKNRNTASGVSNLSSIVIEGYVTTSDSTGNLYELFTIQDATGGIDIKVNTSDLYTVYRLKPGQKVKVKCNGLFYSYYRGTYQIGAAIAELGVSKIVGIPPAQLPSFVERTGRRVTMIPDTIRIDSLNLRPKYALKYTQKLVCIKNVQFKDPNISFTIPGVNTNLSLVDNSGNALVVRASGYATFAKELIPANNGTITGVLGKYDATLQLFIRGLNDLKFINPRFDFTIPTPNTTIAALKAMCTSNSLNITSNIVITGVISGDDESGNLYKLLNIQDETGGITFSINMTGLYPHYPVGTRVVINCNGLCIGKYGKVVQLGMPPYDYYVTRTEPFLFFNKVYKVESGVAVVPVVTTISGINDNMVNKLITIKDVQFGDSDIGKSWTEPNATTNRYIENILGNRLLIRTSSFASFATTILPSGSGSVTAILTKYNTDYQLAVRGLSDIKLSNARFSFILSEGFSTATVGSAITVNGWKTIAVSGSKTFMAKQYSGDTYAEMNPYNSGEPNNVAWLISPQVNLAGIVNPVLMFQTEYNFWAGVSSYNAYISTDFDGTNATAATWTPLSGATLVQQTDGINTWVSSGMVNLSAYTGKIYVGFKYISSGGTNATAFRVDNVKIFSN